jgi:hypothetical protein
MDRLDKNDTLNYAIALAQGWHIERQDDQYIVYAPNGKRTVYKKRAWAVRYILTKNPNWAESELSAFALCERIARNRLYKLVIEFDWLTYPDKTVHVYKVRFERGDGFRSAAATAETQAGVLAQLALETLQAEKITV